MSAFYAASWTALGILYLVAIPHFVHEGLWGSMVASLVICFGCLYAAEFHRK